MSIKDIIKNCVSTVIGNIRRSQKSKVVYYHDVYDNTCYTDMGTSINTFLSHLDVIESLGFRIVDNIENPHNEVMICFDDGFRGIWDTRTYFYSRNLRPTVFIANALIGREGYLSLDEIKELSEHGFKFEGHSWSHKNLTCFSEKELEHELYDSRLALSRDLGKEIKSICFPQGFYSELVIRKSIEAGYSKLFTSDTAPYGVMPHPLVGRYLFQFDSPSRVKHTLMGGMDIFRTYSKIIHFRK